MTFWSIVRSPLILGADMTKLDKATLALLTNDEVLVVNQASEGNRQLFEKGDLITWVADVPGSKDKYLAVFNHRRRARSRRAFLRRVYRPRRFAARLRALPSSAR